MATSLFELTAQLKLDVEDFVTKMKEAEQSGGNFRKEVEDANESAEKMIKSAKNWAFAVGTSIGRFATDAIKMAAEYDTVQRRFAWIFGDSTEAAKASIEALSDSVGVHYDRLQDTASAFYAQFTGYGMTSEEAISAMVTALSLTADAAMLSGMSIEDAGDKLADFLRGSNEAGEALKIFSNEEVRAAAALDLYGEKWDKLNSAQQQHVMLKIAHDAYESSGLLGYASENADSFSNSIANIRAQWDRLKIAIGTPLLKAIEPALASFTDFVDNSGETIEDFIASIGQLASSLSELAQAGITWLADNPTVTDTALGWVKGLFGLGGNKKGKFGNVASKLIGNVDFNALYADFAAMVEEYIRAYDAYYDAYHTKGEDTTDEKARLDNARSALDDSEYSLRNFDYLLARLGIEDSGSAWREGGNVTSDDIMTALSAFADIPTEIKEAIANALGDINITVTVDGAGLSGAVDTNMGINNARGRYTTPAFSA